MRRRTAGIVPLIVALELANGVARGLGAQATTIALRGSVIGADGSVPGAAAVEVLSRETGMRHRATRPILVHGDDLIIRAGLRCTIRVTLEQVAEIGRMKPDFGKESVSLSFLATPTHWLTLAEPIEAEGPYGSRRRVRAIGLAPDAPRDFERVANARRA